MTNLKCTSERRSGGAARGEGNLGIDGAGENRDAGAVVEEGAEKRCDVQKKKLSAMEIALRKLNTRARTEKEIRDALAEKGCSAEEAEQTVEELKDYGYIDDKDYCKQYFRYSKRKGKADFRILGELERKGIGVDLSRRAFEEIRNELSGDEIDKTSLWEDGVELDDRALAQQVGERMARMQAESGREIDDKFLARVGRRLAGLGYDSGTAYQVLGLIRERWSDDDEWASDEDGEGC